MIIILFFTIFAQAYKVAIIGCGIGGATLGSLLPQATIFESNYQCGGRINHVLVPGVEAIELGATFFIKDNVYLQRLIEKLHLKTYKRDLGKLGVIKNKEIIFQKSDSDIVDLVKMVYNYGMSPKTMKNIVDEVLANFQGIYDFLDAGKYYNNLNEFLEIVKLNNITMNFAQYLQENGINEQFQEEFVNAVLISIYNQKNVTTIAGLIGMVAAFSDAYSIKGGNRQLINEQDLKIVYSKVDLIKRLRNGKFEVQNQEYDYVVVANLINLDLSFDNIREMNYFSYQNNKETYVYVVAGKLGQKYFGKNIDDINTVVILDDPNLTEIRLECKKCFSGWNIYKLQGKNPLQLDSIFEAYQTIFQKEWNDAYPVFEEAISTSQFEFEKNFFYLNSMENLASCIELMMIQAKNIANIIESREKTSHEDL